MSGTPVDDRFISGLTDLKAIGRYKIVRKLGQGGTARVRKDRTDIALLGAGECFGEMAFISGQARSASVVTATACVLLKISATLLDRSSKSIQLQFYRSFATTLVRRLVKAP